MVPTPASLKPFLPGWGAWGDCTRRDPNICTGCMCNRFYREFAGKNPRHVFYNPILPGLGWFRSYFQPLPYLRLHGNNRFMGHAITFIDHVLGTIGFKVWACRAPLPGFVMLQIADWPAPLANTPGIRHNHALPSNSECLWHFLQPQTRVAARVVPHLLQQPHAWFSCITINPYW